MDLKIVVSMPKGKLAPETDLPAFQQNVEGQLGNIAEANGLVLSTSSEGAPDGALGAEQLILFVIENFEEIAQISKNTAIIAQAVNSLVQMFLKERKDESKEEPEIEIKVDDETLELPANKKELDAFLSKVKEKHEPDNSDEKDKEK